MRFSQLNTRIPEDCELELLARLAKSRDCSHMELGSDHMSRRKEKPKIAVSLMRRISEVEVE